MATTAKGTPYVVSTDLVANYPTVSSDLATHIDAKLAYNAVTINAQTGTTYTFVLADASEGKLVTATNAAALTYTVPPQSSVTWASGAVLRLLNQGAGTVTLVGGSGVTLNGASLSLSQYQYAELYRTASDTWTVTGIATVPGLVKITDSSFTNASSVSINNCFSSTYNAYRIILSIPTPNGNIQFRLRSSGTDATASNYRWAYSYTGAGAWVTGVSNADAATGTDLWRIVAAGTANVSWSVDIHAPFLAEPTKCLGSMVEDRGGLAWGGYHTLSTSYDGFTVYPSTSTITGTVRVYGYRN